MRRMSWITIRHYFINSLINLISYIHFGITFKLMCCRLMSFLAHNCGSWYEEGEGIGARSSKPQYSRSQEIRSISLFDLTVAYHNCNEEYSRFRPWITNLVINQKNNFLLSTIIIYWKMLRIATLQVLSVLASSGRSVTSFHYHIPIFQFCGDNNRDWSGVHEYRKQYRDCFRW